MLSRLLALLVVLAAVLPVQGWARLAEACHEPDRCACRRDEAVAAPLAVARRIDCCATPCEATPAPAPAALSRSEQVAASPSVPLVFVATAAVAIVADHARPHARTRGPPPRRFAVVEHWLI